jgi:HD superfamily phosphohydrolase
VPRQKFIQDPVHGGLRLDSVFLKLIESTELQRLHSVHQLGLAYLVYPGANHSRFEHSLGTFYVAGRMCSSLRLDPDETDLARCAALLHDIGHLPYSHTFEVVLQEQFGINHEEISRRLIRGEDTVTTEEERRILGDCESVPEMLESSGVSPREVASLLEGGRSEATGQGTLSRHRGQAHFNTRRYLSQVVSGTVDADQLDYLVRDAHYTGVAYGVIDLDRLLETFTVFNGDLVVGKGGLSAVEGMLVARALMFSAVYFHKTVRISELMLAKAVEMLGPDEIGAIHRMTDASLLAHLKSKGGYHEEIATRIKYRRLFKKAYALPVLDTKDEQWAVIEAMGTVRRRRTLEAEIAARAGTDPGNVIIDVPSHELPVSEPRIALADVRILDGGKVRMLPRMSSIASSLQNRRVHEWAVMVACPAADVEKVGRASKRVLSL